MDLQEQVEKLRDMLAAANEKIAAVEAEKERTKNFWMQALAERDSARQMLKSLKTIVAALEVEPSFK